MFLNHTTILGWALFLNHAQLILFAGIPFIIREMHKLSAKFSFPAKKQPSSEEWVPQPREIADLRKALTLYHGGARVEKWFGRRSKDLHFGSRSIAEGADLLLYDSCVYERAHCLKYILSRLSVPFDVNTRICYHPDPQVIPRLLDPTKAYLRRSVIQSTLLHGAVEGGSSVIVKFLVNQMSADVNVADCCSRTPLLIAMVNRSLEIALFLVKKGADVNYQDNSGVTALIHAVTIPAMYLLVEPLLKAGAKVDLTDSYGYTAFHVAVGTGTITALRTMLLFGVSPMIGAGPNVPCALLLADHLNYIHNDFRHDVRLKAIANVLLSHPNCPPSLKVDVLLLRATYLFTSSISVGLSVKLKQINSVKCLDVLKQVAALQRKLGLQTVPSSEEAAEELGFCTEQATLEFICREFDNWSFLLQMKLSYLCLLIRERCLGYGECSVIHCHLIYGVWMIGQAHYKEGLLLLLRASKMLNCQTRRMGHTVFVNPTKLVHFALKYLGNSTWRLSNAPSHLVASIFFPVTRNVTISLVDYINFTLSKHTHTFLLNNDDLVTLYIYILREQYDTLGLMNFGCRLIELFPQKLMGPYACTTTLLHVILHLNDCNVHLPDGYLVAFLDWGAKKWINSPGEFGKRPLHVASDRRTISMLCEYGAHLDAVDGEGRTARFVVLHNGNVRVTSEKLPKTMSMVVGDGPRPLSCLSAMSVVEHGIPYADLEISPRMKMFILLHDPNGT